MGNGLLDFQKRCQGLILVQMQDIGKGSRHFTLPTSPFQLHLGTLSGRIKDDPARHEVGQMVYPSMIRQELKLHGFSDPLPR